VGRAVSGVDGCLSGIAVTHDVSPSEYFPLPLFQFGHGGTSFSEYKKTLKSDRLQGLWGDTL
jgi:hypothetical protein